MGRIKVTYVRTQFWFRLKAGGSVAHTVGVLNGMKNNRCKVNIVSNEKFLGIKDFTYKIINPLKLKPDWLGELLYNFYARHLLKKSILFLKPDFIYHRYTGYTFFVTALAKRLNIPLILEFNSFDSWKLKYWERSNNAFKKFIQQFILFRIVKAIENFNLGRSSLIVTVSNPLRDDLLKMGFPKGKIMVIPNGFDPKKFNTKLVTNEQCESLKRELKVSNGKIIVGFSGTFGPWHGIPQLSEAIDKILKSYSSKSIHFLIIGDGSQLITKMKKALSDLREITYTGMVPYSDVQRYLAVCDVLVSPHCIPTDGKEFFGSPTKIFEYMAMGKAIVASKLGQIGRVLENNKTAVLVEPGNVGQLIEGILKLVDNKELRLKLGRNARNEVLKKYTWDRNVKKLLNKLKEMNITFRANED